MSPPSFPVSLPSLVLSPLEPSKPVVEVLAKLGLLLCSTLESKEGQEVTTG